MQKIKIYLSIGILIFCPSVRRHVNCETTRLDAASNHVQNINAFQSSLSLCVTRVIFVRYYEPFRQALRDITLKL